MKEYITIQKVLFCVLGLLLALGLYLYNHQPINTESFRKDNASFDTTSFSKYEKGIVEEVLEDRVDEAPKNRLLYERLMIKLISGDKKGEIIETEFTQILDVTESARYKVGEKVILGLVATQPFNELILSNSPEYVIVDRYRVNGLIFAIAVFILLAFVSGRSKGLLSILGLGITALVLIFFTAPQLLDGKSPVLVAGVSAGVIAIITMFIAHGFNLRTKISILSTLIALVCAIVVSFALVYIVQLFGLGQADAFVLQAGYLGSINLRGLLLAGLIISLLGVLDDVTTAQTATVDELLKANPDLNFKKLYSSAMSVGREHIASLINTLILVYVGAGLPLFLLLMAATNQPLWVLLNSENISEEIVRALAGSMALILAVPISTSLAAWIYSRKRKSTT